MTTLQGSLLLNLSLSSTPSSKLKRFQFSRCASFTYTPLSLPNSYLSAPQSSRNFGFGPRTSLVSCTLHPYNANENLNQELNQESDLVDSHSSSEVKDSILKEFSGENSSVSNVGKPETDEFGGEKLEFEVKSKFGKVGLEKGDGKSEKEVEAEGFRHNNKSSSRQQQEQEAAAMVLKTELCRFSGAKIYPGKGIRFIRSDSQVFLFANSKCKRYFHNRLKPSKLTWTAMYRKQHKKDIAQEAVKKRRRTTKKPYSRSIVGATLEVIQKRRTEKPEVRDAAREAALREIKERIKKTKDEKKAKKAEVTKSQKSQGKGSITKGGAQPKGPKLGGGGGKR